MRSIPVSLLVPPILCVLALTPVRAERLLIDDQVNSDRAAQHALDGDVAEARQAAARIGRLELRDRAFSRVIGILTRRGQEKAALVVLSRMSNAGRRDDAMVDMGIALARQGKLSEARKLATHLDPWRRDRVRAAIALAQGERGKIREGWREARRISDLPRRRQALIAYRSGLAHSITPRAAIGAALGAKSRRGRVLSLLGVARRLVLDGKAPAAIAALSWARQIAERVQGDEALRSQTAADTALILLDAGDFEGARQSAASVSDAGLRQFLIRQVDETRMLLP